MERVLVSDVMTRDPIISKPDKNLLDCAKIMVRKRVGSLPLIEKKKLVGFVSRKDILWALIKKSRKDLSKITAIEISPKKIATIKPNATIKEALEKMKKTKFLTLPVIHEGQLVGMITARDILNFHPELYPEIKELDQIREESNKLKRIQKAKQVKEGVCEECGNYDVLTMVHGNLICENCRESM
jgi:CBS domain-containing protein